MFSDALVICLRVLLAPLCQYATVSSYDCTAQANRTTLCSAALFLCGIIITEDTGLLRFLPSRQNGFTTLVTVCSENSCCLRAFGSLWQNSIKPTHIKSSSKRVFLVMVLQTESQTHKSQSEEVSVSRRAGTRAVLPSDWLRGTPVNDLLPTAYRSALRAEPECCHNYHSRGALVKWERWWYQ